MTRMVLIARAPRSLAGLGIVVALLAACAACSPTPGPQPLATTGAPPSPTVSSPPAPTGRPVHVRFYQGDGMTYGVGMPIIAYISAMITDARPFVAAAQVSVN